MSGIQSSIGLITGIPIQDTVDQLIALSARSRDLLVQRAAKFSTQQVAINDLTAVIASLELSINQFGEDSLYEAAAITSSRPDLLDFVKTGNPTPGSYQFTPIRKASNHQFLSERIVSDTNPLGAGSLSFQFGGHLDSSVSLDELNGGSGVQRGKIEITDRSGSSAVIDLRFAFDVDDVIEEINNATGINVTASTQGDQFVLTDNTGQTASNLIVNQVGTGTTAEDLGLDNIDVASDSATGADVVFLSENTALSTLNNGNGIGIKKGVADLSITLSDATTVEVDFENEVTIGEILDTINSIDPAKFEARISADGDRIEIEDKNLLPIVSFQISSINGSTAAEDLGIDKSTPGFPFPDDTITGDRIHAGLKTSLISRLSGGSGINDLGTVNITDRLGGTATIDLSTAETLDDVIAAINASATIQVTAVLNEARNGIEIRDESGGTGNLVVANSGDSTTTADKLGIAGDVSEDQIVGSSLDLQTVSTNSKLADLNFGAGIDDGSFLITDSLGAAAAINLAVSQPETLGDLIDEINSLGIGVQARINDSGTGLLVEDTGLGSGTLTIADQGSSTAASDLRIEGEAVGGQLDGSFRTTIDIDSDDTIDDLVTKINEATGGATASKIFDGIGYRLALNSSITGKSGELLLDSLPSGIDFEQTAAAEDALLLYGALSESGLGVLVSSSTNTFDQLVPGLELNIQGASTEAVTIDIESNDQPLIDNIKAFVDQFNNIVDKIQELRSFESNESENDVQISTGVLFGTTELLKVENALNDIVTDRIFSAGSIQSLAELGIDFNGDTGKLELDEEKLGAKLASDRDAVIEFIRTEDFGLADRFQATIDQLSGEENSILVNRNNTLQNKIDFLNERIERKTEQLDRERTRLLNQFFTLESTIQKLQSSQTALASIVPLQPIRIANNQ